MKELKPLRKKELEQKCVHYNVEKIGNKNELQQRLADAMVVPQETLDTWAEGVSALFEDVRPGHSEISMRYLTRFNMVDQYDRDFYSQGPKTWRGSVFGKWLLDLLFLAKGNAYARFLAHSVENNPSQAPITFKVFTSNAIAQLGEACRTKQQ